MPKGFAGIDLTWVSDSQGWALGSAPCPSPSGCSAIVHTLDSGVSWTAINAPGAVANYQGSDCNTGTPCVKALRFGSPSAAYAYGPALFHTLDGGQTWQPEPVSAPVLGLEYAGRAVFRVLGTPATPTSLVCFDGCRLQRAGATGLAWNDAGPVLRTAAVRLAIDGGQRIYVAGIANSAGGRQDKHAEYQISRDGGQTWEIRADPCPGNTYTVDIASALSGQLFALCHNDASPDQNTIVHSGDSGRTFSRPLATTLQGVVYAGNASVLSGISFQGTHMEVESTFDGGATWRTTLSCPPEANKEPVPLGYQDGHTAHMICPSSTVWRTQDGGATWRRSSF